MHNLVNNNYKEMWIYRNKHSFTNILLVNKFIKSNPTHIRINILSILMYYLQNHSLYNLKDILLYNIMLRFIEK